MLDRQGFPPFPQPFLLEQSIRWGQPSGARVIPAAMSLAPITVE